MAAINCAMRPVVLTIIALKLVEQQGTYKEKSTVRSYDDRFPRSIQGQVPRQVRHGRHAKLPLNHILDIVYDNFTFNGLLCHAQSKRQLINVF